MKYTVSKTDIAWGVLNIALIIAGLIAKDPEIKRAFYSLPIGSCAGYSSTNIVLGMMERFGK